MEESDDDENNSTDSSGSSSSSYKGSSSSSCHSSNSSSSNRNRRKSPDRTSVLDFRSASAASRYMTLTDNNISQNKTDKKVETHRVTENGRNRASASRVIKVSSQSLRDTETSRQPDNNDVDSGNDDDDTFCCQTTPVVYVTHKCYGNLPIVCRALSSADKSCRHNVKKKFRLYDVATTSKSEQRHLAPVDKKPMNDMETDTPHKRGLPSFFPFNNSHMTWLLNNSTSSGCSCSAAEVYVGPIEKKMTRSYKSLLRDLADLYRDKDLKKPFRPVPKTTRYSDNIVSTTSDSPTPPPANNDGHVRETRFSNNSKCRPKRKTIRADAATADEVSRSASKVNSILTADENKGAAVNDRFKERVLHFASAQRQNISTGTNVDRELINTVDNVNLISTAVGAYLSHLRDANDRHSSRASIISTQPDIMELEITSIEQCHQPYVPQPYIPDQYVPEPYVPEPNVPEPYVPEPYVPEPYVPEPYVPEPYVPEPYVPEPYASVQYLPQPCLSHYHGPESVVLVSSTALIDTFQPKVLSEPQPTPLLNRRKSFNEKRKQIGPNISKTNSELFEKLTGSSRTSSTSRDCRSRDTETAHSNAVEAATVNKVQDVEEYLGESNKAKVSFRSQIALQLSVSARVGETIEAVKSRFKSGGLTEDQQGVDSGKEIHNIEEELGLTINEMINWGTLSSLVTPIHSPTCCVSVELHGKSGRKRKIRTIDESRGTKKRSIIIHDKSGDTMQMECGVEDELNIEGDIKNIRGENSKREGSATGQEVPRVKSRNKVRKIDRRRTERDCKDDSKRKRHLKENIHIDDERNHDNLILVSDDDVINDTPRRPSFPSRDESIYLSDGGTASKKPVKKLSRVDSPIMTLNITPSKPQLNNSTSGKYSNTKTRTPDKMWSHDNENTKSQTGDDMKSGQPVNNNVENVKSQNQGIIQQTLCDKPALEYQESNDHLSGRECPDTLVLTDVPEQHQSTVNIRSGRGSIQAMSQNDSYPGVTLYNTYPVVTSHTMYPVVTTYNTYPGVTSHNMHPITSHNMYPATSNNTCAFMTSHNMYLVPTPHNTYPVVTSRNIYPLLTSHSMYPVVSSHNMYPLVTSYNTYPGVTSHSMYPVVSSHNMYPLVTSYNTYPGVTSHSMCPLVTSYNTYPGVISHNMPPITSHNMYPATSYNTCTVMMSHDTYPVVTSHNMYPQETSYNTYPGVTPHNMHPITSHNTYPAVTSHNMYPLVTSYNTYPGVMSHNMPPITSHNMFPATSHNTCTVMTSHDAYPVVTSHNMYPLETSYNTYPGVTPHNLHPITSHNMYPVVTTELQASHCSGSMSHLSSESLALLRASKPRRWDKDTADSTLLHIVNPVHVSRDTVKTPNQVQMHRDEILQHRGGAQPQHGVGAHPEHGVGAHPEPYLQDYKLPEPTLGLYMAVSGNASLMTTMLEPRLENDRFRQGYSSSHNMTSAEQISVDHTPAGHTLAGYISTGHISVSYMSASHTSAGNALSNRTSASGTLAGHTSACHTSASHSNNSNYSKAAADISHQRSHITSSQHITSSRCIASSHHVASAQTMATSRPSIMSHDSRIVVTSQPTSATSSSATPTKCIASLSTSYDSSHKTYSSSSITSTTTTTAAGLDWTKCFTSTTTSTKTYLTTPHTAAGVTSCVTSRSEYMSSLATSLASPLDVLSWSNNNSTSSTLTELIGWNSLSTQSATNHNPASNDERGQRNTGSVDESYDDPHLDTEIEGQEESTKLNIDMLVTWMKSVLVFLGRCNELEIQRTDISQIHSIYKRALRLCRDAGELMNSNKNIPQKLRILSWTLEAFVCLRMFLLRRKSLAQTVMVIDVFERNRGLGETSSHPSQHETSTTPAPHELENGLLIPYSVWSAHKAYIHHTGYYLQYYDLLCNAKSLAQQYPGFMSSLNLSCGALTPTSSIDEITAYIQRGIHLVQLEHSAPLK